VLKRPAPRTLSSLVITSMVAERFVRVHADDHTLRRTHMPSVARSDGFVELGGHRYFELRKPLLSLSLPMATPGTAQAT
jgi:hypothetical protein